VSATVIRTVPTEKGDIQYNSDMPVRALKGLLGSSGDMDGIISNLAVFVTAWPFEGEPSDPEAWEDLARSEFNTTVKAVMEDLGKLGEE
jgi:hypothetical protein